MAKAPNTAGHGPGGDIKGMKSPGGKALTAPKAGTGDLNSIMMPRGKSAESGGKNIFGKNYGNG